MNHKALTAREVSEVLRDAASGRRSIRRVGNQMSKAASARVSTIDIDGWVITFSRREFIQCGSCFSPGGRSYDFQSALNRGTDPLALLSPHEFEHLALQLNAAGATGHPH